MEAILCIDFGSTYTKLTAIDLQGEQILGTSKGLTTVEDGIMVGFEKALASLTALIGPVEFTEKLACSSAAGGLKMVAVGLVPELTAEAAKRAALGAGARVLGVYSYELTKSDLAEIKAVEPDLLLLAGGTDGGNRDCILHNARMIAEHVPGVPVVVAGNKNARDDIEAVFDQQGIYYKLVPNVMPRLNELQVEPAREAIRGIFMEKIVEAKGLAQVEELVGGILMPTPAAVLAAAQVLSDGTDRSVGIGPLIVVDIGGATTDIHSIGSGEPTKPSVVWKGLQEPHAKRTVEGDLGMRVSAVSLWETAGTRRIAKHLPDFQGSVEARCRTLQDEVSFVADTPESVAFDEALAKTAVEIAMERHCGVVESVYTPMGLFLSQTGKDLSECKTVIGTGGVLVHSANASELVGAGFYTEDNPTCLKPLAPHVLIDRSYMLSAMGLLAERDPELALRLMKKYLIQSAEVRHGA
ncbi:MutL protein [Tumebacillus algifaecis]|uniref:MutL protein n=1 Tax=Tumebacillus algifaecis TaxID=1214604 RepID=A0A223CY78_9BACL|nr:methylaspartate mutase accessory protein GlmL [Tumebacillus algifaecis]ASS74117.1 MutL protein [Tumebacillus algifaecis]